ncbi:MAG: hypothetical protein QOK18_100 [Mycobacterium sp.]|nr:hypothetical protein [Mycobacterium sp.]
MVWCRICPPGLRGSSASGPSTTRGRGRRSGITQCVWVRAGTSTGQHPTHHSARGLRRVPGRARGADAARRPGRSAGRRRADLGRRAESLREQGSRTRQLVPGQPSPDMERPPSLGSWSDKTEGLGGRVAAENSLARAGDPHVEQRILPVLLAGSHLTCPYVIQFLGPPPFSCTSDRTPEPMARQPIFATCQGSRAMAAWTSAASSAAIGGVRSDSPSRVCTRAASVTLDNSQTP